LISTPRKEVCKNLQICSIKLVILTKQEFNFAIFNLPPVNEHALEIPKN
jgi:hypothetical protein